MAAVSEVLGQLKGKTVIVRLVAGDDAGGTLSGTLVEVYSDAIELKSTRGAITYVYAHGIVTIGEVHPSGLAHSFPNRGVQ